MHEPGSLALLRWLLSWYYTMSIYWPVYHAFPGRRKGEEKRNLQPLRKAGCSSNLDAGTQAIRAVMKSRFLFASSNVQPLYWWSGSSGCRPGHTYCLKNQPPKGLLLWPDGWLYLTIAVVIWSQPHSYFRDKCLGWNRKSKRLENNILFLWVLKA